MGRVTKFTVGDFVHCIKRGAFGQNIFRDESDYWRFVRLLYLCNDEYQDHNSKKLENTLQLFERPNHWPLRETLVDIIAWVAMPNHFHLLLRESRKGGIGKFMQRLSGSITMTFNVKYNNQGSIFQSKYKPVLVADDEHLTYLISYINVKNVCELYPNGGLRGSVADYDTAYEWARTYRFSSLRNWTDGTPSPLLDMEEITDSRSDRGVVKFWPNEASFKDFSLDVLQFSAEKKQAGQDDYNYDEFYINKTSFIKDKTKEEEKDYLTPIRHLNFDPVDEEVGGSE